MLMKFKLKKFFLFPQKKKKCLRKLLDKIMGRLKKIKISNYMLRKQYWTFSVIKVVPWFFSWINYVLQLAYFDFQVNIILAGILSTCTCVLVNDTITFKSPFECIFSFYMVNRKYWRLMMVQVKGNTLLDSGKIAWHFVLRWKMSSQWGCDSTFNPYCFSHQMLLFMLSLLWVSIKKNITKS